MPPGRWSDDIELEELSPERGGYQFAKEKVQSTIKHDEVQSFDIKSVYRIKNKYTWKRYGERRAEISQELGGAWVKEMRLFHGSIHAKTIATEGFDRGFAKKSGMFRDGVYFAEHSSKSNNYAFGAFKPCEVHNDVQCETCVRRILICKVALGKIYETKKTVKVLPEGYHSVKAVPDNGFLLYPEYIIYNDDQVYPSFLVEYTAKYKAGLGRDVTSYEIVQSCPVARGVKGPTEATVLGKPQRIRDKALPTLQGRPSAPDFEVSSLGLVLRGPQGDINEEARPSSAAQSSFPHKTNVKLGRGSSRLVPSARGPNPGLAEYSSKGINNTSGSSLRETMQTMKQSNPIKLQRNSNIMDMEIFLIFIVTTVLVATLMIYELGAKAFQVVFSNFSL